MRNPLPVKNIRVEWKPLWKPDPEWHHSCDLKDRAAPKAAFFYVIQIFMKNPVTVSETSRSGEQENKRETKKGNMTI